MTTTAIQRRAPHALPSILLAALALLGARDSLWAQADLETILTFRRGPNQPASGVIQASDGALYGTTFRGGLHDSGTIFRVSKDGTGFTLLHEFDCSDPADGCRPTASLIEGSDGVLYGTTSDGGGLFRGAVFRIEKDGTGFSLVHSFTLCPSTTSSCFPGAVIEGSDGALYGTARRGGLFREGEIFRVNRDGSGYLRLHSSRCDVSDDGCLPSGAMEGNDGRIYGVTEFGGALDDGILFAVNANGTGFTVVHHFDCPRTGAGVSCRPNPGLIQASNGAIYGTTRAAAGELYRINTDGTGFTPVLTFGTGVNAFGPEPGVIQARDGALYGTTTLGGAFVDGVVFRVALDGSGFAILHSFECGTASTDACHPFTGVIEADDGALYATAQAIGTLTTLDSGVVFSLGKDGTGFRVLHAFRCGGPGCLPESPLLEASDGLLYGTTNGGGAYGAGVAFRVNQDGSGFAVLHDFGCGAASGCLPGRAALVEGSDGALYGTTSKGGAFGQGTAFRLEKDGTGMSFLHSFECQAGRYSCAPSDRLLEASDGALYGMTNSGGLEDHGTIFRMERNGSGFTELRSLTCATDGCFPLAALIEGSDGALYGTTVSSGPLAAGTVIRINKDGSGFSVLYAFNSSDGGNPSGGLIEASDGFLYGATSNGGASFTGTIYRIAKDGTGFSQLHSLACSTDGCRPRGELIEGADGALYGTASIGVGPASKGTVFRILKDGSAFTLIHKFVFPCTGDNGCFPYAGVTEGSDGAFYGTTREGGGGAGTLYRLTLDAASLPPVLIVSSPEPGAVIPEGEALVEGTASDDVEVAKVTVDGFESALTPTGNPGDANEVFFSVPLALAVGDHTIEVIATDADGNTDSALIDVHVIPVDTMAPVVTEVVTDPNPVEVGVPVRLTAEIDDRSTGDSEIVASTYSVDGGPLRPLFPLDGAYDSSRESVESDLPGFEAPGIHEICVTAEDEAGNASAPACTLLAVYDPGAGFVTGGGWIHSLPGSYSPDPSLAGRSSFGFVAKYRNGSSVPIGSTEFQVHEAGLNFHSTAYEWLVMNEDGSARYRGTGTVNGSTAPGGAPYQFMVWAGDGDPDTVRIRIWWDDSGQVIQLYDSGTMILGGGSVVVH